MKIRRKIANGRGDGLQNLYRRIRVPAVAADANDVRDTSDERHAALPRHSEVLIRRYRRVGRPLADFLGRMTLLTFMLPSC